MPLRRMAIFVTNKESTHEKSENQPDKTLPMVLEIPEMQSIIEYQCFRPQIERGLTND